MTARPIKITPSLNERSVRASSVASLETPERTSNQVQLPRRSSRWIVMNWVRRSCRGTLRRCSFKPQTGGGGKVFGRTQRSSPPLTYLKCPTTRRPNWWRRRQCLDPFQNRTCKGKLVWEEIEGKCIQGFHAFMSVEEPFLELCHLDDGLVYEFQPDLANSTRGVAPYRWQFLLPRLRC